MKALLLVTLTLQGCAIQAIGCWVQNDDSRYSFTWQWHLTDKDLSFEPPTRGQWEVIRELQAQRAEAP